jgi:acyl carrier protein
MNDSIVDDRPEGTGVSRAAADANAERIVQWLKSYLADLTGIDAREIDIKSTFDRFGLDSYQGVVMAHELAEWLSSPVDPTDVFDHPSISELAAFLSAVSRRPGSAHGAS